MDDILKHLWNPTVRKNQILERKVKAAARKFLEVNDFQEYNTPILMPKHGEKYNPLFSINIEETASTLADSPQIFKMMLSLAGIERYYQIAHCFRPIEFESAKHTRLCEFTQIDLEMRVKNLSELITVSKELLAEVLGEVGLKPRVTHMEGSDCLRWYGPQMKPDLRKNKEELSVVFIEHMPLTVKERTLSQSFVPCHHIFALPSCSIEEIREDTLIHTKTESFDLVVNGIEIGGGDLRIMDRDLQSSIMDLFDVEKENYLEYLEMLGSHSQEQRGGFAIGLERLIMAVSGCEDIRETVCFPDFYKRRGF